jgi:hypothetical protein
MFNAGNDQQTRLANLAAQNREREFNAGLQGEYGLAQAGFDQQAGLAGAETRNQFALQQAGMDQQRNLAQAGMYADASQFGANALNGNSQFNAGMRDAYTGRQLQGAGLYGDLANNFASNMRSDVMTQAQLGDYQRQIAQQQALAPWQQIQLAGQSYAYGNPMIGQTVNTNGTSSGTSTQKQSGGGLGGLLGSALSGWASGGFAIPSDRRAKRDIERIETGPHGLGIYRYNYLWDEPERARRVGVMADEVMEKMPHAMGPVIGGIHTVNYAALGLSHLVEG